MDIKMKWPCNNHFGIYELEWCAAKWFCNNYKLNIMLKLLVFAARKRIYLFLTTLRLNINTTYKIYMKIFIIFTEQHAIILETLYVSSSPKGETSKSYNNKKVEPNNDYDVLSWTVLEYETLTRLPNYLKTCIFGENWNSGWKHNKMLSQ